METIGSQTDRTVPKVPGSIRAKIVAWQFATRISMITFATVCLRGMLLGSEFLGTIRSALLAGAGFYCLGAIVGEIARRVVEESVQSELEKLFATESESAGVTKKDKS